MFIAPELSKAFVIPGVSGGIIPAKEEGQGI